MKKVEISIPSFVSFVPIKITVLCDHEHEVDIDHIQKCIAKQRAALIESFEQLGKNLEKASGSIHLSDISHKDISCCYDIELKLKPSLPPEGYMREEVRKELAKILKEAISHPEPLQV